MVLARQQAIQEAIRKQERVRRMEQSMKLIELGAEKTTWNALCLNEVASRLATSSGGFFNVKIHDGGKFSILYISLLSLMFSCVIGLQLRFQ